MIREESLAQPEAIAADSATPATGWPPLINSLADHVVVFRAGSFIVVSYGVYATVGALVSMALLSVLLLGQGVSRWEFLALAVAACAGAIVLSRIVALALDYRRLFQDPLNTLRSTTFVSWGGIIALIITSIAFSWALGYGLLMVMDTIVRVGPLGHAIGRLGCVAYGCCYGRPTDSRLAVRYYSEDSKPVRAGGPAMKGRALHPSALYEAGLNIGIFGFINALWFMGVPAGVPTAAYLALYGTGRFIIEFARDNGGRIVWRGLAFNHVVSAAMAAVGVAMLPAMVVLNSALPELSFAEGIRQTAPILPLIVLCSLLIFLGLAVQRHRVGEW